MQNHKQNSKDPHALAAMTNRALHPIRPVGNRVKLLRELGLKKPLLAQAMVDCWASDLERRVLFYSSDPEDNGPDITHFVRDDSTDNFLYTLATLEHQPQYIL
jgi:hypothetical protein